MFFDNGDFFEFDKSIISPSGKEIQVYRINSVMLENDILDNWATGLRWNYVEKNILDSLVIGTGLTKKEYLEKNIFPDPKSRQGSATMSGEFGEILVLDFINFVKQFYVTRTRYLDKNNRNMPVPGSDVIGYKINNLEQPSNIDTMIVAEVKTRSNKDGNKLNNCEIAIRDSIKDSLKDRVRIAESLNAEKRRLLVRGKKNEARIVERFQNKTDTPYVLKFFAVAVLDSELYYEQVILDVVEKEKENLDNTNILIIYSSELKMFLRDLFRRACEC